MRRFALITTVVLLIVAGLYTAGWYWARDIVTLELERRVALAEAEGAEVDLQTPQVVGFPFGLRVETGGVSLRHPRGWDWTAADLRAGVSIFSPTTARLGTEVPQVVRISPPGSAGAAVLLTIGRTDGEATVTFDRRLDTARLDLDQVTVAAPAAPELEIAAIRATAEQSASGAEIAALGVDLVMQTITATPNPLPGLDSTIQSIVADVIVIGPPPRSPRARDLAAWRDAGGILRIETAGIYWDEVIIRVAGDLVLDEALQPRGTLEVVVEGHEALLAAAVQAGLMGRYEAGAFGFALATLAQPGESGAVQIRAPLTIRDQSLQVGAIPLPVSLPRIDWPG